MPDPVFPFDRTTVDILDLIEEPEPIYNWVVPDALERRDRLILTGEEGYGKSTFLRQFGVQTAAGIHPFTLEPIEAQRVVLLDAENSREQVRQQSRRLVEAAGRRLKPGQFTYLIRSEGLDFDKMPDVDWLRRKLAVLEPDLLIAGPHYKLGSGDPASEEVGGRVVSVIDSIRTEFDVAFVLEAHSPHSQQNNARPTRPFGWSGWLRWPEFGKHLGREGSFTQWRGDRAPRTWPRKFVRGDEWPWMVADGSRPELWGQIVNHCEQEGERPSIRLLAEVLGVGKSTVERCVAANRKGWDDLV